MSSATSSGEGVFPSPSLLAGRVNNIQHQLQSNKRFGFEFQELQLQLFGIIKLGLGVGQPAVLVFVLAQNQNWVSIDQLS